MALSQSGVRALTKDGKPSIGMARIISQYPDVSQCMTSFYSFRGNYFASFTFPSTEISWIFNQNSITWAQSDFNDDEDNDLIIDAVQSEEVVLTSTGLAQLSLQPDNKKRTIIAPRLVNYKGQENFRNLANGFEIRMVQGFYQPTQPNYVELTFSIDSQSWLNTVRRQIGFTGQRNSIITWRTNLAAYEYTPKVEFYGNYDFIIERMTMTIN
jgi:hypothetical protein